MTKSQKRRADQEAFARTMLRAKRRFVLECPTLCKYWGCSLAILALLLWIVFAMAGAPQYLDSLFSGCAFAGALSAISLQRKQIVQTEIKHEEEKRKDKLRAEVAEANYHINAFLDAIRRFSILNENGTYIEESGSIYKIVPQAQQINGMQAFLTLQMNIITYANVLSAYNGDREELAKATRHLFFYVNSASGESILFLRAVLYLTRTAYLIDENERKRLLSGLLCQTNGFAQFVIATALQGNTDFPVNNEIFAPMMKTYIPSTLQGLYQPHVIETFMFALRCRNYNHTHGGTPEDAAEAIACFLEAARAAKQTVE